MLQNAICASSTWLIAQILLIAITNQTPAATQTLAQFFLKRSIASLVASNMSSQMQPAPWSSGAEVAQLKVPPRARTYVLVAIYIS